MVPGELFLANFPFGDAPGMKLRPVLLLTAPVGPIPEVLVAYISSVLPQTLIASDLLLDPAQADHASTNYLGRLSMATEAEVLAKLRVMLGT